MLYQNAEDAVRSCLESNEKLLWSGKPAGGVRLRAADAFMIPFSIFWTGFAAFWEIMACSGLWAKGAAKDAGWFFWIFPLWGIPFILVGLYLMFGRFWTDAKQRENTSYGITDRRVIMISGLWNQKVRSLDLKSLSDFTMTQSADGSGSITMAPLNPLLQLLGNPRWSGSSDQTAIPTLEMIPEVAKVYKIMREAHSSIVKTQKPAEAQ
jgi:hypothetical protein